MSYFSYTNLYMKFYILTISLCSFIACSAVRPIQKVMNEENSTENKGDYIRFTQDEFVLECNDEILECHIMDLSLIHI